jgi:hypothetical protein
MSVYLNLFGEEGSVKFIKHFKGARATSLRTTATLLQLFNYVHESSKRDQRLV